MKLKYNAPRFTALFFLFLFLMSGAFLHARFASCDTKKNLPEIKLPEMPRDYVTDLAGIIAPPVRQELNGYLQGLEKQTTAQVLVLTVPSLEGQDIDEYSLKVAEKWKPGQKGKDNGMLLVVAPTERRYRFEVGYGLEGTLPDSFVGTVGRQYLVPYFKRGDYSTGIALAVQAVAVQIAQDANVQLPGLSNAPSPQDAAGQAESRSSPFRLIFSGVIFLIVFLLFIRHPGLFLLFFLGGGGGGGFGDGGFGGGGSFGGGGGGGFGGGGASGGW